MTNVKPGKLTRRNLIKSAAIGSLAGSGLLGSVSYAESRVARQRTWDQETDIIVVGSGAAASTAALFAHQEGASVIVLEKNFLPGGTTAKSGGRIWIPNNHLMRKRDIPDNREDCLRYMARLSYPTLYHGKDKQFGLNDHQYKLLTAYYDNAAPTIETLIAMEAVNFKPWLNGGEDMADYYSDIPENKAPQGRALECPLNEELGGRGGAQMVREFQAALHSRQIPVLLDHRATKLITNQDGEIIGVEAATEENTVSLRARRAVVFGSGGFTHNPDMVQHFVRGPIYGGCASGTAEGDFVYMATAVGAKLANMGHVWGRPLLLEQVLENRETPDGAWLMGDSLLQVNAAGQRVTNEMLAYNERNQVHYIWDPAKARYANLISFVIYDEPCRQRFGTEYAGIAAVLKPGLSANYVIQGDSLEELARNIGKRLNQLADRIGGFTLDDNFSEGLHTSIQRFNSFANTGNDQDFHRGETLYEQQNFRDFMGDKLQARTPNRALSPIADKGPYYCVMICPGTLDTKGGPKINHLAQVLNQEDQPVPGLYGAGNCIGSPGAQAYWSGGTTLGLALTFGAIAGREAASEPVKPVT